MRGAQKAMTSPMLSIVQDEGELPVTHGRLLDFTDDPIACMRRLHARHGPIAALEEDGHRIHFIFSPAYNHQVLSDSTRFHSQFFAVRGPRKSAQRELTSGLLTMNGDQHKQHRRMVMEAFTRKAIQGYTVSVQRELQVLLADWEAGQVRDINQDMTELMLRITSSLLFGMDDPEAAYELGHKIDHWVHLNHEVGMGAYVASPQIAGMYDSLLADAEVLKQDIVAMIQRRRSRRGESHDALSLFLQGFETQGGMTEGELIGHAALMFGAAHLTTAHTLTWTFFLLAQHPSMMRQVHAELQQELGDREPRPDELDRLPLMERVIKESMRCLPASSYSQRVAAETLELGPFSLPRGSGIIFSQFMTHHLASEYRNPERFEPDRWLSISPSPYAYLPFGAGPRMCIGATMAMVILKLAIPTVLQRFKLSAVAGSEVSARVISTMLSPTCPVYLEVGAQDGAYMARPVTGNIADLVELPEVPQTQRRAA